jgi:hypothetical protein
MAIPTIRIVHNTVGMLVSRKSHVTLIQKSTYVQFYSPVMPAVQARSTHRFKTNFARVYSALCG